MKELGDKHKLLVDMPYVLLHILLKNNALKLYCNNVDPSECFYMYIRKCPLEWLISAFYWNRTPEGPEFWENIFEQTVVEINKAYGTNKKRKTAIKA